MPQGVEIVLTAHPTQINRRTLQYKHIRIAVSYQWFADNIKYSVTALVLISIFIFMQHLLDYNDRSDLSHEDREMLIEDLVLRFELILFVRKSLLLCR